MGSHANLRRQMVGLSSPEGLSLMYASVPALTAVGALIATTSRGALLAFLGSVVVTTVFVSRRRSAAGPGP